MKKLCLMAAAAVVLQAQGGYVPTKENIKTREWFQNARFGMFIHWGVYSVLGDGEWVMNNKKIPISEYEPLAAKFNPVKFDAAEWVSLAKAAGMRYITITSKHHDGFAMWGTQQNKWNIVDATPYGKDPLKTLAEECRKQGLKLFFYHSQLDWHHPDYYPRGRTGTASGRPESGDFNRYLDFMDAQLTELLTNYGDVSGIWFDGMWDKPKAEWRLAQTYGLIHKLRPAAMVGSNHHLKPFDGEDFQMFEKDLPGHNTTGFSGESEVGKLPLETCDTINRAWGYNATDTRFKSTGELIRYLVRAAGYGANFLLNIGPRPDGTIQPEFVERLRQIGEWTSKNGESIYGTKGGPVSPRPWGVTTQTADRVYVHVLEWRDELLAIPDLGPVKNARLLGSGAKVDLKKVDGGMLLRLPRRDEVDTIVVVDKAK
ncbi:MAG: alpha-L-fucosidase [Bryobacteraceae bacterium]